MAKLKLENNQYMSDISILKAQIENKEKLIARLLKKNGKMVTRNDNTKPKNLN